MRGIIIFIAALLHSVGFSQSSVGYLNFHSLTEHTAYAKFYIEMDSLNLNFELYIDSLSNGLSNSRLINSCFPSRTDDSLLSNSIQKKKDFLIKIDSLVEQATLDYLNNSNALIDKFNVQYANDLFIFKHKYNFDKIIDDPIVYHHQNCTDITILFLNYLNLRYGG
ncbi:MAG: hypothetical protein ACI8ZM_004994 [Crocinitomix sp.]|jgi:hypothetical protein